MKAFFPAFSWAILILIGSVAKAPDLPNPLENVNALDKLVHAFAYFVFTALLIWGFHRQGKPFSPYSWYSLGIAILLGILMEVIQYAFFPHRHFELFDIMANIIGSFLGLFALKIFLK